MDIRKATTLMSSFDVTLNCDVASNCKLKEKYQLKHVEVLVHLRNVALHACWELAWLVDPHDDVGWLRRNVFEDYKIVVGEVFDILHLPYQHLIFEDDHAGRVGHVVYFDGMFIVPGHLKSAKWAMGYVGFYSREGSAKWSRF